MGARYVSVTAEDEKIGNMAYFLKSGVTSKNAVDLPGRSSRRLLQYFKFINLNSAPRLLLRTRLVDH